MRLFIVFGKDSENMLFIDTNTLYYAFGLSSHSSVSGKKICQIIDSHEKVVISSISFAEFVCKYHKHANTIRRVLPVVHTIYPFPFRRSVSDNTREVFLYTFLYSKYSN